VLPRRRFCAFTAGALFSIPAIARAALDRHARAVCDRVAIGVVDFDAPSSSPRSYVLDLVTGRSSVMLVAHGRGSDSAHSGWVERFSNIPGSEASSARAYLTADIYAGKHGRSRRLKGLDGDNSNVEARGIVIHAAAYVDEGIAKASGKIGRSEGCLALASADLHHVLDPLGTGRLIYVDKVSAAALSGQSGGAAHRFDRGRCGARFAAQLIDDVECIAGLNLDRAPRLARKLRGGVLPEGHAGTEHVLERGGGHDLISQLEFLVASVREERGRLLLL